MSSTHNSYLTFKIGEEIFGVNVVKVLEIREYQPPNPLPQTFSFVPGVIEYLDEIIPLIDTGIKFGMPPVSIQHSTCVIILQLISNTLGKTYRVGILVDTVADVIESDDANSREINNEYKPSYITSATHAAEKLVFILDADLVFNQKEIIGMMELTKNLKKKI